jgi:iron complex transport system permease protein
MISFSRNSVKTNFLISISSLSVIGLFVVSIFIGKYGLTIEEIYKIITHTSEDPMAINVFYKLRLPRSIMVVLAGIGLAMAGSVFQTLFKNPLASPDIIGVTSGASVGAAFSIVFLAGNVFTIALGAFLGGIIAISFVIGLVRLSNSNDIQTYVLSGIVINAISNGIIMALKYFSDPENELGTIEFWIMGSFGSITSEKLIMILPFFLIGMVGIFLMRWTINILSLSDDEGKALGIAVERSRYLILLLATLIVASIVSVTGLISFVALIPPHIARTILRRNDFWTTVFSGLLGAILITISDCLARSLLYSELPISIITSFIGAPYLAFLVWKKGLSQVK